MISSSYLSWTIVFPRSLDLSRSRYAAINHLWLVLTRFKRFARVPRRALSVHYWGTLDSRPLVDTLPGFCQFCSLHLPIFICQSLKSINLFYFFLTLGNNLAFINPRNFINIRILFLSLLDDTIFFIILSLQDITNLNSVISSCTSPRM